MELSERGGVPFEAVLLRDEVDDIGRSIHSC